MYTVNIPPIHMCISAELSAMRLNTLLGVMTAKALGLQEWQEESKKRQTDRWTNRERDRHMDGQADGQADGQTDRQTD